tara:strand:+ start:2887 stop:4512 length:1626 start_codon:yes stop_codon:yes gene_type:complete
LFNNIDVVFVADVFFEDIPQGGAEIVNRQIVNSLKEYGLNVEEVQSFKVTPAYISKRKNSVFILGSFLRVPAQSLNEIMNCNYILYEHDHKYCINRNPADYDNFKIPENELIYQELFKRAKIVACQSKLHADILKTNLPYLTNVVNMGGSFWSEDFLKHVERAIKNPPQRKNKAAILKSSNPIKRQAEAELFCENNSIEYDLIESNTPYELFEKLQQYEYYVYFPSTPETFSRVFMEAKLAGCKVITNNLIGAASESYDYSSQGNLLNQIVNHKKSSLEKIKNWIDDLKPNKTSELNFVSNDPIISIITSVYEGADFIDQFMEEMVQQTIFDKCEMLLVDCNKRNNSYESNVIKKYIELYPNIHYFKLDKDPGVYGAWNHAIKNCKGKYITNANLDDRRSYDNLEVCLDVLNKNSTIDLVYPMFLMDTAPNQTFYTSRALNIFPSYEYDKKIMHKCLPGCMPLWKKELHDKNGFFNDSYSSAGDLEFWLRCVKNGSSFKRIPVVLGNYYFNPHGLSTSQSNNEKKTKEERSVLEEYKDLFV